MNDYPEHDKLRAISGKSQAIGEFLDWLGAEKHWFLAEWDGIKRADGDERAWPASYSITKLLAEFFEIDLDKIEAEKRAMLEALRA